MATGLHVFENLTKSDGRTADNVATFPCMIVRGNGGLIDAAVAVLHPHRVGDRLFGDVASALVTDAGHVYVGVCIDTASGTGFCAEHAAIAAMVTAREYKIAKIVAVWRGEDQGPVHVVPPCGRCREFIRQIDPANLETEVVLGMHRTSTLRELLPATDWSASLD